MLILDSSDLESDKLKSKNSRRCVRTTERYRTHGEDDCDTVLMTVNGLQFKITKSIAAALTHIRLLRSASETIL